MFGLGKSVDLVPRERTVPGRETEMALINRHFVTARPLKGEFPGMQRVLFGMGCFWGVERMFWGLPGVYTTAVGYAGGATPNPTYKEVCAGLTNHNEVVLVVFDPQQTSFEALSKVFWENHDPTQGMRQGNDAGTQYRSGIYCADPVQLAAAQDSKALFQAKLRDARYGAITTEILPMPAFYYAEDYHQQYLAKNPDGYCGIGGTGVTCPIGLATA